MGISDRHHERGGAAELLRVKGEILLRSSTAPTVVATAPIH
jgi:hypothetical protein